MFKFPVKRRTEDEINQAVKDLKERGFDLLTPIKEVYKQGKFFGQTGRQFSGKNEYRCEGYQDNRYYECWMKKVQLDEQECNASS